MKIFLASSTSKHKVQLQHDLIDYLKTKYVVFHYSHVLSSPNDKYSFSYLVEKINEADIFIGEMSKSSQTLGFQLSHALQLSKPCLYLYRGDEKGLPSGLIGNIPSRGLKIKRYDSSNYRRVIDSFIVFAEKQLFTTRTSFMSTREIDDYISQESKRQGTSKGELIRQILHASIENKH